jgi:chromosome segregation ATPase
VVNLEQTEKLVLKLDESRRENECLNEKLFTSEGRCKKLESEIFTNNEEKEKLIAIVNQKKVELEDLVGRMAKADQRISALQAV